MFSGCAFLTYFSRDSAALAQHALHEKRTLPGVSHTILFNYSFLHYYYSHNNLKSIPVALAGK